MKKIMALFTGIILACLAAPVFAGSVSVDVISDNGSVFPVYNTSSKSQSIHRAYLEAKKGAKYGIRITNNTGRRAGLVVAVDGRNIVSGKKSYLKNTEKMYILDPYTSATYEGWRTAQDQVNRFYFTSDQNSYAAAWGDNSAMGVIAVAVYYEKPIPEPVYETQNYDGICATAPAGIVANKSLSKGAASENAGTGFGSEKYSPSIKVSFEPESYIAEKHLLKYEWRETLCKKHIIDCSYPPKNRLWDEGDNQYAPYPPNKK